MDDGGLDPRWLGASIPAEHWHFHQQLLVRYGIVMAPGEFSRMLKLIRNGDALVVDRRRGRDIVSIRLQEPRERIYVLASGSRVVTAWPPSAALNAKRRALQGGKLVEAAETSSETCGTK